MLRTPPFRIPKNSESFTLKILRMNGEILVLLHRLDFRCEWDLRWNCKRRNLHFENFNRLGSYLSLRSRFSDLVDWKRWSNGSFMREDGKEKVTRLPLSTMTDFPPETVTSMYVHHRYLCGPSPSVRSTTITKSLLVRRRFFCLPWKQQKTVLFNLVRFQHFGHTYRDLVDGM